MKNTKFFIIMSLSLFLTSCSLLFPQKETPKKQYLLQTPVISKNKTVKPIRKTLLVSTIRSPSWLDTPNMAYMRGSNEISYFAENQWAASPAELLQPIIASTLQNVGLYQVVVSAPFNGKSDDILDIQLLDMQQVFDKKPSYYQLSMTVRLMNTNTQKVIAVKNINLTTTAPLDNPEGGVFAADQAVSLAMNEIIQFIHAHNT
jgi:cholesterol transport system auxiliary component